MPPEGVGFPVVYARMVRYSHAVRLLAAVDDAAVQLALFRALILKRRHNAP